MKLIHYIGHKPLEEENRFD